MKEVKFITQAAAIAALYVVLTLLANALGLASGTIQVRFSEALTILPFFTSAAVPGLFIGCLLANIMGQCVIWDIIFGSIATLLGALGTYAIRKKLPDWCAAIPPILANTLIIPFILAYAYEVPDSIPFLMLTVGAGEVISCGILGTMLLKVLEKYKTVLFTNTEY
ncbi:MAG: QueT transporter family protein [Lachnospiraceae bacterium]|nr:QueT transporter family protein [Lachnospiraceae bacterium]